MKISIDQNDGRDYRYGSIEELAVLIDELAAVAWDRDCAGITIVAADDGHDLRFTDLQPYYDETGRYRHRGLWEAYTGERGNRIAYWDKTTRSWKRTR